MAGYTGEGKNVMLDALGAEVAEVGLLVAGTAITAVTGVAATNVLTKSGHGLSNGDIVVGSALSGGLGLIEGDPLYVIGVSGNDFQLSRTSGGSALDFTTDIVSLTLEELTEVSGGSPAYSREPIAFANPASDGQIDDTSNGVDLNVPAGTEPTHVGYWDGSAVLLGVSDVVDEAFVGQGIYEVTNVVFNLNN